MLIEGLTRALDNDAVLSLKQGNVASPSRVVPDERGAAYVVHHGHRTAISQRALQAHADRFLGWASLPGPDGPVGYVVSEVSPYEADLDERAAQAWDWCIATSPGQPRRRLGSPRQTHPREGTR